MSRIFRFRVTDPDGVDLYPDPTTDEKKSDSDPTLKTDPVGKNPIWVQSHVSEISCRCNPILVQICLGTILCGCNSVGTILCGCNSVGTIVGVPFRGYNPERLQLRGYHP